jgi:hypothetical protein
MKSNGLTFEAASYVRRRMEATSSTSLEALVRSVVAFKTASRAIDITIESNATATSSTGSGDAQCTFGEYALKTASHFRESSGRQSIAGSSGTMVLDEEDLPPYFALLASTVREPGKQGRLPPREKRSLYYSTLRQLVSEYFAACSIHREAVLSSSNSIHTRFLSIVDQMRLANSPLESTVKPKTELRRRLETELCDLKLELFRVGSQFGYAIVSGRTRQARLQRLSGQTHVHKDLGLCIQQYPSDAMLRHHSNCLSELLSNPASSNLFDSPLAVGIEVVGRFFLVTTMFPAMQVEVGAGRNGKPTNDVAAGGGVQQGVCLKPYQNQQIRYSFQHLASISHSFATFPKPSSGATGSASSSLPTYSSLSEAAMDEGTLCVRGEDRRLYLLCAVGLFPYCTQSRFYLPCLQTNQALEVSGDANGRDSEFGSMRHCIRDKVALDFLSEAFELAESSRWSLTVEKEADSDAKTIYSESRRQYEREEKRRLAEKEKMVKEEAELKRKASAVAATTDDSVDEPTNKKPPSQKPQAANQVSRPLILDHASAKALMSEIALTSGSTRMASIQQCDVRHQSRLSLLSPLDSLVDDLVTNLSNKSAAIGSISLASLLHQHGLSVKHLNYVHDRLMERIHAWEEAKMLAYRRQGELESSSRTSSVLAGVSVHSLAAAASSCDHLIEAAKMGVSLVCVEKVARIAAKIFSELTRRLFPVRDDLPSQYPKAQLAILANWMMSTFFFPPAAIHDEGKDTRKEAEEEEDEEEGPDGAKRNGTLRAQIPIHQRHMEHETLDLLMRASLDYFELPPSADKEHLIEAVPSWIRYVAVARRLASLCGLLLGPGRVFIDSTSRWITEINVSTPWFLSLRGKNLADFMRLEMEALRTFRRRNLLHAIPFVHLRLLDACHRSDTVDEALFRHVEEEADSVTAQHGDADASGPMQRNGDQSTGGQHHLYEIAKRSLGAKIFQEFVSGFGRSPKVDGEMLENLQHLLALSTSVQKVITLQQTAEVTSVVYLADRVRCIASIYGSLSFWLAQQGLGLAAFTPAPTPAASPVHGSSLVTAGPTDRSETPSPASPNDQQHQQQSSPTTQASRTTSFKASPVDGQAKVVRRIMTLLVEALTSTQSTVEQIMTSRLGSTAAGEFTTWLLLRIFDLLLEIRSAHSSDAVMVANERHAFITKLHGEGSAPTLASECEVASAMARKGDFVGAQTAFEDVLGHIRKKLSEPLPSEVSTNRHDLLRLKVSSTNNLAFVHYRQARKLFAQFLRKQQNGLANDAAAAGGSPTFSSPKIAQIVAMKRLRLPPESLDHLTRGEQLLSSIIDEFDLAPASPPAQPAQPPNTLPSTNSRPSLVRTGSSATGKPPISGGGGGGGFNSTASFIQEKPSKTGSMPLVRKGSGSASGILKPSEQANPQELSGPGKRVTIVSSPLSHSDPNSPKTIKIEIPAELQGDLFNNLGAIYLLREQYCNATRAFELSLAVTLGVLPNTHPDREAASRNLRECQTQHLAKARRYLMMYINRKRASKRVARLKLGRSIALVIQMVGRGFRSRKTVARLFRKRHRGSTLEQVMLLQVAQRLGRAFLSRLSLVKPYRHLKQQRENQEKHRAKLAERQRLEAAALEAQKKDPAAGTGKKDQQEKLGWERPLRPGELLPVPPKAEPGRPPGSGGSIDNLSLSGSGKSSKSSGTNPSSSIAPRRRSPRAQKGHLSAPAGGGKGKGADPLSTLDDVRKSILHDASIISEVQSGTEKGEPETFNSRITQGKVTLLQALGRGFASRALLARLMMLRQSRLKGRRGKPK